MAKGAGMLAPGLATMLVVLTTDADVDAADARHGAARRDPPHLRPGRLRRLHVDQRHRAAARLRRLRGRAGAATSSPRPCTTVCADLARQLIGDAEGASKDISIEVVDAATEDDAVEVGRSIARNNLLKCAIHGEDPNWGRVLSADRHHDAPPSSPTGSTSPSTASGSAGTAASARTATWSTCATARSHITADLAAGTEAATIWTNDLTADYVHENSAYSLMTTTTAKQNLRGSSTPLPAARCRKARPSSRRCPG